MKKELAIILASLALIGMGCFYRTPGKEEVIPTSALVSGLFGVIDSIDPSAHTAELGLPDGSIESLRFSGDISVPAIGSLVRIDGVREFSTREVTPVTIVSVEGPALQVTSPLPGSIVTSPLVVFGFGRVFEQQFAWRIKDAAGLKVASGHAFTHATDSGHFGPFRIEIVLPAVTDPGISLEVFNYSAKDGKEENLVSIPLQMLTVETTTVQAYYPNSKKGSLKDCTAVFPVTRTIAKTSAVGRAAIMKLLDEPTPEEKKLGYFSSIPPYTEIISLSINEGVARVDFTGSIATIAGSCRVGSARAQIEHTLAQFPTVSDIEISVNGSVDEALQP